jgi:hypothetical protein
MLSIISKYFHNKTNYYIQKQYIFLYPLHISKFKNFQKKYQLFGTLTLGISMFLIDKYKYKFHSYSNVILGNHLHMNIYFSPTHIMILYSFLFLSTYNL